MTMKGLAEKVGLVTASGGAGIGQGIARSLLDNGGLPIISDKSEERAREVAKELSDEYNRNVISFKLDVTNEKNVYDVINKAVDEYGSLDFLVNNAGINKIQKLPIDSKTWDQILKVNLYGTYHCTQAALEHMYDEESGAIVNISSVADWLGKGDGQSPYCAAKAGIRGFTRSVAGEVADNGIRVNSVAPGFIYNEFLEEMYDNAYLKNIEEQIPMGRSGEPQDVGDVVCFLLSEESRYITGQTINVSGGWMMK